MTNILVIDDEPGARTLLAMALSGPDVRVDTAATGEDGVRMALATDYDWVVSDVKLPGMNGIEVSERVRSARPDARIVLISAVANEDEIEKVPTINSFWHKPFDPFALRNFLLHDERPDVSSSGVRSKHFYA